MPKAVSKKQALTMPKHARNTMTFPPKDLFHYVCYICKLDCKNYENIQIHFEVTHPVQQKGDDFWQNGRMIATYSNDICVIYGCTNSKKAAINTNEKKGIRKLRYRMHPETDVSGFQGHLPFPDEFEKGNGMFLCINQTENCIVLKN